MVDNKDKPAEQATKISADESKPSSGRLKPMILFGGIGAVAVVLGVVLALFVLKPMMGTSGARTPTENKPKAERARKDTPNDQGHDKGQKASGAEHDGGKNDEGALVYTIKDIVINPAGTGGTRFLSVSFAFELESSEVEAQFVAREAAIRDALITILSSKTVAQLTDAKQKEIARYQIKKRVSDLLHTSDLAGVYYTDFVLQ